MSLEHKEHKTKDEIHFSPLVLQQLILFTKGIAIFWYPVKNCLTTLL